MKKIFTILLAITFYSLLLLTQSCNTFKSSEKVKIFGYKIKAKKVTGIKNFNDVGLYNRTSTFNDLTEDTIAFIQRLGSVRVNFSDYREGTFDLFNLSSVYDVNGFVILDEIDFKYYNRFGFNLIESQKPDLLQDANYKKFKKEIRDKLDSDKVDYKSVRKNFWSDDDNTPLYRSLLLRSRYFYNEQPINISKETIKKLTLNGEVAMNDFLKTFFAKDSFHLKAFFKKQNHKAFKVEGAYISICFQTEYINTIVECLSHIDISNIQNNHEDLFTKNLKLFLDTNNKKLAINSGISAFKFKGNISKSVSDSATINVLLSAMLPQNKANNPNLSAALSIGFESALNKSFKNQFSKVWVFQFGTHYLLNSLGKIDLISRNNYQLINK